MKAILQAIEAGRVPDLLINQGIRRLLARRLRQEEDGGLEAQARRHLEHVAALRAAPIAVETAAANQQHYELPPEFFQLVLGPRLKYSSALWAPGGHELGPAEDAMLRLTCERAQLTHGQDILELGCGWGSLTLWMAEQYPGARILAVSNSRPQKEFIDAACRARGRTNVEVATADMNHFATARTFDRVVSVEMFEHMRNYEELLARISRWLRPAGKLFVHIFVHRCHAYLFETQNDDDWMGRYFFTGGQMPSDDLLLYFQRDLLIEKHWRVNGRHYEKTLLAWLNNMDAARDRVMPIMRQVYGEQEAVRWFNRWRVFFLACAGLFGYRAGTEWFVAHYLFANRSGT